MAQELEPTAMAAAAGQAPVSPAKATAADWSSLPSDLVRRIADCFLDTNDVDWYMDLRAVCHSWRSATDDPKKNPVGVNCNIYSYRDCTRKVTEQCRDRKNTPEMCVFV